MNVLSLLKIIFGFKMIMVMIIIQVKYRSETFSSNSSGQLNILGHDGDSSCMNGTQVGIFKKTNQVGFRCFLQSQNSGTLESEFGFVFVGNISNQSLEGEFSNKQFGALLVFSNFSKSDCAWSESVSLFDSSSGGCTFSSGLGSELLSGGFSSGGFSCSLFSSGHFVVS